MDCKDWQTATSRLINIMGIAALAIGAGKVFRSFMFKH